MRESGWSRDVTEEIAAGLAQACAYRGERGTLKGSDADRVQRLQHRDRLFIADAEFVD